MKYHALCLSFGLIAASQSFGFTDLFVFGDSLSDTGNVFASTAGLQPAAPYFNGRYSNGPVWVETLAGGLGISATNSLGGGKNYAFGGAETNPGAALSTLGTANIGTQIALLSGSGQTISSNSLVVVWAGANDFVFANRLPTTTAQNITG
jgi:thermolabile hemolysin